MRRPLACFFVCMEMEAFRRNAQPASMYGDGSVPKERAACIHWMQFGKGLGSSQQAFLHGQRRHDAKIATWYQVALLANSKSTLLCITRIIFVIANCRPLFGFSVYITAFQTEHHHIICPLKKSNITFPAHAAFAMQKPNKLLFHLPATTRAYLVGFTHLTCG